ncbi:methionine--tRNA ligase [Candidatus Gottesmanbacteria bacterium]|nr:methionine--tRNA ligase [Candidatus Gottesmanbacteria bacterium]
MNTKTFYITTTTPYVNADPHIGFALEIIQADASARFKRLEGYDVCFNWGTDEHGLKIYRKALELKKDPKEYCDIYAERFKKLIPILNLSSTNFIRTTDEYHIKAAQEFWRTCDKNGDIYKKNYRTKYCVGCELEKTDSELIDGRCPIHPQLEIEIIEEENYFFRFSKYQRKLLELYEQNPRFVVPEIRFNEIKAFVKQGLEDFSISRLKKKMPWGIEVPGDPEQVMYVWFDALINYISTIGWPADIKRFEKWWPVVQVAGKDNLRQQSAIWQAMLMSAGLPPSRQIFIHGFITSEGQRISKSLGNVVDPIDLVNRYGVDPLRYYLLREIPAHGDGDYSEKRFKDLYNADLANGLGNVVARIARLAEKVTLLPAPVKKLSNKFKTHLENYRFDEALALIWQEIRSLDQYINDKEPWKISDPQKLTQVLQPTVERVGWIAFHLQPFLPETAEKILKQFSTDIIKTQPPLFPRL